MNKNLKYTLVGLLVVALVGVAAVGIAYAQDDDPTHPREILADLLGLTFDELREKIQGGSSLEELADEAGVDLDAFRQEMHEAREDEMRSQLEEKLANGDITQEQYDWMMEGLENGYMGEGKGPGGFHGRGEFEDGDGNRPFGGRGGFGGGRKPGSWCGMEGLDS